MSTFRLVSVVTTDEGSLGRFGDGRNGPTKAPDTGRSASAPSSGLRLRASSAHAVESVATTSTIKANRIEALMKVDMARFQGAVLQAVERADRCDGMILSLNPHLWHPEHRQSFDRDEQPWDITWSVLGAFSARHPDLGPNDFTLVYHGTESASHVRCFLLDGLQEEPGKCKATAVFAPVAKDCRRLDRTHSPWWPRRKGSGRDNLGVVVCVLPKSACRTHRDGAIEAYVCDALPVATYQYKSRDQARDNSNALM